jgi:hypothetical protein
MERGWADSSPAWGERLACLMRTLGVAEGIDGEFGSESGRDRMASSTFLAWMNQYPDKDKSWRTYFSNSSLSILESDV